MIGEISTFVQGTTVSRLRRLVGLHVAGGACGGAAVGAVLGLVGVALGALPEVSHAPARWLLIVMLATAGLVDLSFTGSQAAAITRQTPRNWECVLGPSGVAFAWGADLGTGLTTRLSAWSTMSIVAVPILVNDFGLALSYCVVFGAARAATVGTITLMRNSALARCDLLSGRSARYQRLSGISLLLVSTTLTLAVLN